MHLEAKHFTTKNAITMPGFDCLLLSGLCNFRVENGGGGYKGWGV